MQDIYKSFCQDNLGPEHLIPNPDAARNYLTSELEEYKQDLEAGLYAIPTLRYYPVGDEGNYIRVDLSVILDGLIGLEEYLDAFVRSANSGVKKSHDEWKKETVFFDDTSWPFLDGVFKHLRLLLGKTNKICFSLGLYVNLRPYSTNSHKIMEYSKEYRRSYV